MCSVLIWMRIQDPHIPCETGTQRHRRLMTHACHKQISGSFCWYLLSDGSSAPSCSWATKCPPCQQYKRHTHGRYSHNHLTNRQTSARIFRYPKQPTVQLFDAHKKGICFGFVSKADAISFLNSKTSLVKHAIGINTPRGCANHLWIFKHFSHILFLYCFVTCFLMLSSIHRSHFVNTANFFLT